MSVSLFNFDTQIPQASMSSSSAKQVMAMKECDGQNVRFPVFVWGFLPRSIGEAGYSHGFEPQRDNRMQFYCVDLMLDDALSQEKFRLSLHAGYDSHSNKRKRTDDGFSDVIALDFPKGALGLRLSGDSIAKGMLQTSIAASLGSCIYLIGGDKSHIFDDTLCCLDTSALYLGWYTHNMKLGRAYPKVVGVDGKLYIVGGVLGPARTFVDGKGPKRTLLDCHGEIFDTQTGQSELMADAPPQHGGHIIFITFLHEPKEILFLSSSTLHLLYYSINNDEWRVGEEENKKNLRRVTRKFCRSVHVVVGKIIYWFGIRSFKLTAYDFSTSKFYKSNRSLRMDLRQHGHPHREIQTVGFFHLREDCFCLLWRDVFSGNWFPDAPDTYYRQLRCTKLQICIDEDNNDLTASLLSTQTYLFDGQVGVKNSIAVPSSSSRAVTCELP